MNRKNLAREISRRKKIPITKAESFLMEIFQVMEEQMVHGEKILIRDFGKFECKTRPATRRRNPQSGDMIELPERKTVVFTPSKELKGKLNDSIS